MVALGDPIGTGLVESLAKPGGNLTGMLQMTSALAAQRLQLLKEAIPAISRVLILTYLVDQISPLQAQAMKEAAPALDLTPLFHDISTANNLPTAFEQGSKEGAQAVTTTAEAYFGPIVRK
jgi:putative ABC transport system substrate-binding protein